MSRSPSRRWRRIRLPAVDTARLGHAAARVDAGGGAQASVTKSSFGTLADGTAVDLYTLTNAKGVEMRVTNYGGIIVSLNVPDRNGALGDVVLGYNRSTTT